MVVHSPLKIISAKSPCVLSDNNNNKTLFFIFRCINYKDFLFNPKDRYNCIVHPLFTNLQLFFFFSFLCFIHLPFYCNYFHISLSVFLTWLQVVLYISRNNLIVHLNLLIVTLISFWSFPGTFISLISSPPITILDYIKPQSRKIG